MNFIKKAFFVLVISNFLLSQNITPQDGARLNYTQIFFKWPQISHSTNYEIKIVNDDEVNFYYSDKNSISINQFYWGEEYLWEICGFDQFNNMIDCNEQHSFSINYLPENYPNNINIISNDSSQYQNGITMLDYESLNFSLALNQFGEPVWFANRYNFNNSRILASEIISNGNIIGFGPGKGYEFDLNSNIIFETPNNFGVHHWFSKTPNDTYLFIDTDIQYKTCPIECTSEMPNTIPWQGDKFVEIDNNGNLIWEWNTFDYLELEEYNSMWVDSYISSWNFGGSPSFDWTHSNSVVYDNINDIVYVSVRNLSRIIAIDYTSKEILWNMGNPSFMSEVFFDDNFGFSHQHSVQLTEENNLLFFDNGRGNHPEQSRCVEIEFNENNIPELKWNFMLPDSMLTLSRGECDRLLNNNTLITAGRTGNVIEVNSQNEIIWHLNVKDDNLPVSIYRSKRIENLFPNVFTFKINNLFGTDGNYQILNISENINFTIYNEGWSKQNFIYQLLNQSNVVIYEQEITLDAYEEENYSIDLANFESENYSLRVFNAEDLNDLYSPENFNIIEFGTNFILGDNNNDLLINILDITNIVNFILFDESYDYQYDIRFDGGINISDIIYLINIILYN